MAVPNIFGTATSAIPLSQLDTNFATAITLGNTAVYLGNTTTSLGNVTLTNVTISSGNVTVSAGSNTAPSITTVSDTNTGIFFPAADTIAFSEGGAEAMRIDSSGQVGIGTTSPSAPLHVQAITGGVAMRFTGRASPADGYSDISFYNNANTTLFAGIGALDAGLYLATNQAIPLVFLTNSAEVGRFDSSGNLFVGTTSNFSADKMCLNFTSAQNGIGIRDDSNSSGATYAVFRNSANGIVGSITRVTTTNAVTYNTTSDQRLKSNIADASPVLDKLMAVKVRQFDWTDGDLHQDAGFIAQELAPVLSGIVTEGRTEDDLWQLDYARLTPYLVKAIQEQQALITALTARITALESN
jgi:hypothetical protein